MNNVDKCAVSLRYVAILVFIILSIVFYLLFSGQKQDDNRSTTMALWPPDMVPHGPHFPKPPDGPRDPAKLFHS